MPSRILKDAFSAIGDKSLNLNNNSLQNGVFSEKWKNFMIMSVPKVENTRISCL